MIYLFIHETLFINYEPDIRATKIFKTWVFLVITDIQRKKFKSVKNSMIKYE